MTPAAKPLYAGYRFLPEVIGHAVEMLAARGILASHETVRQWARKFGQPFADQLWRQLPRPGDKWHLDEVVIKVAGTVVHVWNGPRSTRALA